ncbi:S8 family serine peptidase [uncultured Eubacterium sp.]|uniref:S8 family serine peptidase n=1 Tax=uncultured Eubacterium sp. TaxID=165185 RepID=UPI002593D77F|nr:S8 family serine peptidase [uncultured Eubacterium sp.]
MRLNKKITALMLCTSLCLNNLSGVYASDNGASSADANITKYQNDTNFYDEYMEFERESDISELDDKGSEFQTKRLIVEGEVDKDILDHIDDKDVLVTDSGYSVISFADEEHTKEAYDYLRKNNEIKSVSGENVYGVNDINEEYYVEDADINWERNSVYSEDYTANDFLRKDNLSWGSDFIESPFLVDYIKDSKDINKKDVVVAVIDTGVNVKHSIFEDRIVDGARSFVFSEPGIDDKYGHGTHIAGIIVDNTPSNVKILPIKALGANGKGSDLSISAAIDYAVEMGVDAINMSLGGKATWTTSLVEDSIKNAKNNGISVVVSAGNENDNADECSPSRSDACITVSACDDKGNIADFSNYGDCVDVCAPGVSIYSSYKSMYGYLDTYNYESGTSMATPYVTSAICMVKMLNKDFDVNQVEEFIEEHVDEYVADKNYGSGIIDLGSYLDGERCSDVIFDHSSGNPGDNPIEVKLSCATEGASIYYTTDNTTPSVNNGTKYSEPIIVEHKAQIKAIAINEGLLNSNVTKAEYIDDNEVFDSDYLVRDGVICGFKGNIGLLSLRDGLEIQGQKITEIGYRAFRKSKVGDLVISEDIVKLGEEAFADSPVEHVYFLGQIKYIGSRCFYNCKNYNVACSRLTSCAYVGDEAFGKCPKAEYIELPSCLHVGKNIAKECENLKVIGAPKCKNVENDCGKVIDKNTTFQAYTGEGVKVTSNVDEYIYLYYELDEKVYGGKVEKGQTVIVPKNVDIYAMYNNSFKYLDFNGDSVGYYVSDLGMEVESVDYCIKEDTVISYSEKSVKNDVSEALVSFEDDVIHAENGEIPNIKVSLFGTELKEEDMDIVCEDVLKAGIAKMVITGKGDYKGVKEVYYYVSEKKDNEVIEDNNKETDKKDDSKSDVKISVVTNDKLDGKNTSDCENTSKLIKKSAIKKARYSKGKLRLVWKKVKNINGYQIAISSSKKFKKNVKTINIKKSSCYKKIIKKLKNKKLSLRFKKKKAVYVRIRTFVKNDGKNTYSLWSKVVKVKY